MFKRKIFVIVSLLTAVAASWGCGVRTAKERRPEAIVLPAGTVSPTIGVGFDVTYDRSLDNVIPGYKIITVAYKNNSMDLIPMDPVKDKWFLEDRKGRKISAVTNLRNADPDTWEVLPKKLKVLIEYPLLIPIGTAQTIDLLFKESVNVEAFRSVIYRVAGSKQEYKILPREE